MSDTTPAAESSGSTPCPSCPFLTGNHKEFEAVATRLCLKFGRPKPNFWACLSIRESVKRDAITEGRLQCHSTVYDAEMNPHPETSRPCAGLDAYLRETTHEAGRGDVAPGGRRKGESMKTVGATSRWDVTNTPVDEQWAAKRDLRQVVVDNACKDIEQGADGKEPV